MSLANSATLAESSIDILLWDFPLKSHSADAAQANPQAIRFSSIEIARRLVMPPSTTAPRRSCVRKAVGEAFGRGKRREHDLYRQRQERGAEERPDGIADQVADGWERRN